MQNNYAVSYAEAKGVIEYNMINNYMFRYILQQNKKVLTGLICSLLHLKPENVRDIEVTNPIDLAADVSGKEFILDINVKLKMLAQNNEYLEEAANSIYQANAEEIVRQQCRAREDAERRERTLIRNYNRAMDELDSEKQKNTSLQNENASLQNENTALQNEIDSLLARIRELEATSAK